MLSVTNKPIMLSDVMLNLVYAKCNNKLILLSVVKLSAIVLSVVVPLETII